MLSLETQKRLTEFLGECWPTPEWKTPEHKITWCDKCHMEHHRLDFDDWSVVGRLQTKLVGCGVTIKIREFVAVCSPVVEVVASKDGWEVKIVQATLQEAICLAINAYLQAKEEGK